MRELCTLPRRVVPEGRAIAIKQRGAGGVCGVQAVGRRDAFFGQAVCQEHTTEADCSRCDGRYGRVWEWGPQDARACGSFLLVPPACARGPWCLRSSAPYTYPLSPLACMFAALSEV